MNELVFKGQLLLFPQPKQNISVFDLPIWFADGLKPELSGRLKGLDAFPGYDRCFGDASIRRFPIHLGLGIGVPDCEYDDMSLTVIDYRFRWCANVQGTGPQRFEFIDLVEVNLLGPDLL